MTLYPLKFKTIFKDKIWGGDKIKTILGKDFSPLPNCGETWEISGVADNVSVVADGDLAGKSLKELIGEYQGQLVGSAVYEKFGDEFPLLVKFIDANENLSIQVHPNDVLAKARHGGMGKTEMWYIMQADEGAKLISGFNQEVTRDIYQQKFENGQLMDILNQEEVQSDDCYFLPAGRVHTIGKGLLLAEIQQTSDVTYRIYDYDRKDASGNTRELHVEQALDAIDYQYYDEYKTPYEDKYNDTVELIQCQYFTTNKLSFDHSISKDYSNLDSFVINVCLDGKYILSGAFGEVKVQKGDAVLIPASIKEVEYKTEEGFKALESFIA